jgi:hypothetical protein
VKDIRAEEDAMTTLDYRFPEAVDVARAATLPPIRPIG